jgi:hypothetical protein
MRRVLLIMALGLSLAGNIFAELMTNEVKIAQVEGKVRWSQIALGPEGIAHVVFTTSWDNIGGRLWYVSYDGEKASDPFLLLDTSDYSMQPYIATNSNGMIAVAWAQPMNYTVRMRIYDPQVGAWLPSEQVTDWEIHEPSVVLDNYGNVHVSFYGGDRSFCRSKINGAWEKEVQISKEGPNGRMPKLAITKNGQVWCSWVQLDSSNPIFWRYIVHTKKRTATTPWGIQTWVNEDGYSQELPHIAARHDNRAVVTWDDADPGEAVRIVVCTIDEDVRPNPPWPFEYVTGAGTQHFPRIVLDANEKVHLAVQQGAGDEGDGILYVTNKFGGWQSQMMWGAWTKCGGIAADDFGNVAVCWAHFLGELGSDVYINSLEPIVPKYFYAPVNLGLSVVLTNMKTSPKITYNLSWSANPDNNDQYLSGYNIYMKENTGSYQLLQSLNKTTFSWAAEFDDISKKRQFGISTVNIGGGESAIESFY